MTPASAMTRFFPLLLGLFLVSSACAQDGGMSHDMDHEASEDMHHDMPPMRAADEPRASPNGGVMTTVGTTRCASTDITLSTDHGASMYCGSINPPIDRPNHRLER